jgi:hypothetical protein
MPQPKLVIEVVGEGKTDLGDPSDLETNTAPRTGVMPILTYALCGRPDNMLVRRRKYAHLEKGGRQKKLHFAIRHAKSAGSHGLVFTVDTDEDQSVLTWAAGSHSTLLPIAVGAPRPCIEAWLLVDSKAFVRAIGRPLVEPLPNDPESLPPARDDKRHPKRILARCCGVNQADLRAEKKWAIAREITDPGDLARGCPLSFAPFADQVRSRIKPLFDVAPMDSAATEDPV